jgi:hypothetical protein
VPVTVGVMNERLSPGKLHVAAALVCGGALLTAATVAGSAGAATGPKKLTIYSVATLAQFINHADDRQRARTNNPFKGNLEKLALGENDRGDGPFPGDSTLYSFNLYMSKNQKQKAGTATYTCHYNFEKRALCTVYYKLKDGSTLLASGPVNFNSTSFKLAVTGGTKTYLGANGQVAMIPLTNKLQQLNFLLLG